MENLSYLRHQLLWELFGWPLAAVVGMASFKISPWLPLVVGPIVWQFWNLVILPGHKVVRASIEISQGYVLALRKSCIVFAWLANMIYWLAWVIVTCLKIDHQFGCVVGIVAGFILGPILQIFASTRLRRHRKERVEREAANHRYRHEGTLYPPDHPKHKG